METLTECTHMVEKDLRESSRVGPACEVVIPSLTGKRLPEQTFAYALPISDNAAMDLAILSLPFVGVKNVTFGIAQCGRTTVDTVQIS